MNIITRIRLNRMIARAFKKTLENMESNEFKPRTLDEMIDDILPKPIKEDK